MADKHELDITINSAGEVSIAVSGVDGPGCLKITAELEKELGLVIDREKKSEYYKHSTDIGQEITIE